MDINESTYSTALRDFEDARRQASMQDVLARLTGKSNELLSYEDVAQKLKLSTSSERGVHEIPLDAIVGSVGRYTDFTRTFLPLKSEDRERWARVKTAIDAPSGAGLPPIDVYKVGEVYFVLDGNHRVSIARSEGSRHIEAHIIEVKTDVPLTPDLQPDDLIVKAEYAAFLAQTDLARLRPNVDLSVTIPGQYEKLTQHIEVHRYFMGTNQQREIPYPEAVGHWYDTIYLPLVEPIRERGLLRWFPGRTETDLYLWVSEHRATLEKELGWTARPEAVIEALAAKENPQVENEESTPGSWRKARMFDRYTGRLFRDILVPLSGEENSWQALEQAIFVAQKESAALHGLHVLPPKPKAEYPPASEIQARFSQHCQATGVSGNLAVESGEIPALVCERALLTDLVVLNVAHPPEPGLSSLGSGLRSIIWRSARPILTVPGKTSRMERALVAFDGSLKSKEALFVAAYLSEQWQTALTVLTMGDEASVQDYARKYLDLHEIQANFVITDGAHDNALKVIQEQDIDLVLMGGYGGSAWQEVIIGSAVNHLLRKAECPILICR
jgi:nucleotide-binding universal stress UspA family protein